MIRYLTAYDTNIWRVSLAYSTRDSILHHLIGLHSSEMNWMGSLARFPTFHHRTFASFFVVASVDIVTNYTADMLKGEVGAEGSEWNCGKRV